MLKIGVVGCGYWGNHILRNFTQSEMWELTAICDSDPKQLRKAAQAYPSAQAYDDIESMLAGAELDAVAIATPVFTHFGLAKKALEAGKHIWLEKPLTGSVEEAKKLLALAKEKKLLLHVDHTFIYTPAVEKIKSIIDSGELGEILYFDSVRVNLGLFQHDINVIWDLAPHDFSILQYTIGKTPVAVSATGKSLVRYSDKNLENIAYITVHFADETVAHFHVNWLSPVKIRQIIIGGSEKMLVFNDMEQVEKIKIYDCGVKVTSREDIYETLVQYRSGDMYSPKVDNKEALKEEVEHFHNCIRNSLRTKTDGEAGLYVVKIIDAANRSLKSNGSLIEL